MKLVSIKRVLLIRPGETDWNLSGRWQGQVQIPLNQQGREQAKRMSRFIRPLGLDMLYSSDLRRARDTAEILAKELGTHPIFDPRLRERHMGEWQGLTTEEIQAWYPDEYQALQDRPESYQIHGGESWQQVRKRVWSVFEDMLGRGGGQSDTVGIITHTTAIRTLLDTLVPDCQPLDMDFSNVSATTVVQESDNTWTITQLNDVSHLEGMPTRAVKEIEIEALAHDTGY